MVHYRYPGARSQKELEVREGLISTETKKKPLTRELSQSIHKEKNGKQERTIKKECVT